MDHSEVVYVVAADDDLPISLQLFDADGLLQPQILPKLSPKCSGSDHRDIYVYNQHGSDIADAVSVEVFEYIVDENGEVFPPSTKQNVAPLLNCLASVTADSCMESLTSEDITETSMVTDLKACFAETATFSPGSHHLSQHNEDSCDLECNKLDVSVRVTESIPDRSCSHVVTVSSCTNHILDVSTNWASTAETTAEENQNACTTSVFCEENQLNNMHLFNDVQTGKCSVSFSQENFCHSIPDSVGRVDLPSNNDSQHTGHISAYSSNAGECVNTVMSHLTVSSCAVVKTDTITDTYDTTSNLTVQSLQPCVSSANFTATVCPCEDGAICHQSADKLNNVSTSCLSPVISCNVGSAACVVDSNFVDTETDIFLHSCSMHLEAAVVDSAAVCRLDSYKCQFDDHLRKPIASFDDSFRHNISSRNPVAEHCSDQAEQHSDNLVAMFTEADISRSAASISAITTNELHHSGVNDCSVADTVHVGTVVLPVQQCVWETGMSTCACVSGSVKQTEVTCLPATASYSDGTTKEFIKEKDGVASPGIRPDVDVVDSYNSNVTHNAASEDCHTLEASNDTVDSVMLNKVKEFTDNSDSQLPLEYTSYPCYDVGKRGLMVFTNTCSRNLMEMRQRLCDLHRLKRHLRKVPRNETVTCTLQMNVDLETLCPVKCKRLKLEALDRELSEREMLLRCKEEQLDRREQAVCKHEQLLSQSLFSLSREENPDCMTEISSFVMGDQLNPVSKQASVCESDVVVKDCRRTGKGTAQRHRRYLLRQKVLHTFSKKVLHNCI